MEISNWRNLVIGLLNTLVVKKVNILVKNLHFIRVQNMETVLLLWRPFKSSHKAFKEVRVIYNTIKTLKTLRVFENT